MTRPHAPLPENLASIQTKEVIEVMRNILIIGYPLVCTMDAKSFRICLTRVLCHENRRI